MIVFYINFDDWRLATMAFLSLSLYGYVTVTVTLWRKKFRQATNKHDNDYHDKATDRYIIYYFLSSSKHGMCAPGLCDHGLDLLWW